MVDPQLIRDKPEFMKEVCRRKNVDPSVIDKFLEADKNLKAVRQEQDKQLRIRKLKAQLYYLDKQQTDFEQSDEGQALIAITEEMKRN